MVIFLSFPPYPPHSHLPGPPQHLSGSEMGSLLHALEVTRSHGRLTGRMSFSVPPSLPVRCFLTSPLLSPLLSLAGGLTDLHVGLQFMRRNDMHQPPSFSFL